MVNMVNPNDHLRFVNVLSKKYRTYYKGFDKVMKDFLNGVTDQHATIKGPLFYSINNIPLDKNVNVEFFMPILEDYINTSEDFNFQSYFNIEGMISYCLFTDFEINTEVAYKILLDYIDQNKLRQITPIFQVVSGDRSLQYMFIKIGVTGDGGSNETHWAQ